MAPVPASILVTLLRRLYPKNKCICYNQNKTYWSSLECNSTTMQHRTDKDNMFWKNIFLTEREHLLNFLFTVAINIDSQEKIWKSSTEVWTLCVLSSLEMLLNASSHQRFRLLRQTFAHAASACMTVTLVHPVKAVGRNEMLFGRDTRVAQNNIVLDGGPGSSRKGEIYAVGNSNAAIIQQPRRINIFTSIH